LKPYEDIADPAVAKALAHPLRTRILIALEGGTASPSELADGLDASIGVVSYHVRRLAALGFVKLVKKVPRRGAIEHYYTAVSHPLISDAAWASTPSVVKQATVAPRLEQIGSEAFAALTDGGFDAAKTHLTRTPITVDERGWQQLARKLESLIGEIQTIETQSEKRLTRANHEGEQDVSVVLMLFHRPAVAAPATARTPAKASTGKRRRRG
jgi:DNA-binding transcriptional ArsR family regulator